MLWLVLAAALSPAHADAFRLANGSTVEGTLATYELGGNCQIFVASGPVRGATLLLPCTEILSMSRPGAEAPALAATTPGPPAAPAPLPAEAVAPPTPLVAPVGEPTQAPAAAALPVDAIAPAAEEPVSASLPEGYSLPGDDALAEQVVEEPPAAPPPANLRGSPRAAPRIDAPAEEPGATAPAASEETPPAEEAPEPEGWRKKGDSGMPRWLHRAIYGDETPVPAEGEDS